MMIGLHSSFLAGIFNLMRRFLLFIAIFLTSFACSRLVVRKDLDKGPDLWPQYGRNIRHQRFSPAGPDLPLKLKWTHRASSALGRGIYVSDGVAFYGTLDGKIEGVRLENGKRVGLKKVRGNYAVTCVPAGHFLPVMQRQGQPALFAYDLLTGKKVWKTVCPNSLGEMLVVENKIYFTTANGKLQCRKVADGTLEWSADLENQSHSSLACDKDRLYLGDDAGIFYCYDMDGKRVWTKYTGAALLADPVVFKDNIYIGCLDSNFYAFDNNGQKKWQTECNGRIYNGAAVTNAKIVFGTTGRTVYALDRQSGCVLWTFEAGSVISTAPAIAGNTVYIGSLDKNLYALDLKSGKKVWRYTASGRVRTDPVVVGDTVLFASENDKVYCFGPE